MEPETAIKAVEGWKQLVELYKMIMYAEAATITALAGVIAKMVHWWIFKERARVTVDYQELNNKTLGAIDRNTDYLRDWYKKLFPANGTRTEFDFLADDHKVKK